MGKGKRLERLGLDGGGMSAVSEGQVGAAQCNVGKSFAVRFLSGKAARGGAGRRDSGGPLRLLLPLLLLWLKLPLCFYPEFLSVSLRRL